MVEISSYSRTPVLCKKLIRVKVSFNEVKGSRESMFRDCVKVSDSRARKEFLRIIF